MALVTRQWPSNGNATKASIMTLASGRSKQTFRTSGLQAPILELHGHSGEVFVARFDPTGNVIASGSMDRNILLWRTYENNENYGILSGHKGAILDLQWARDSQVVFSASADMTIASWDVETGARLRRHVGHQEIINSMDVTKRGDELIVSGSDDCYIGLWDSRQKLAVDFMETSFPVTAVAVSEAGNEVYSGGIDDEIKVWDVRQRAVIYSLAGHGDSITSLRLSPDGQTLLSNSHDSTVRTWDIRPFAPPKRMLRAYDGAPTGMERNLLKANWDSAGKRIIAGSGDGTAVIWDAHSGRLIHKLPGHKGAVNDVSFSPVEQSILLSASSDGMMILGELTR